jgi:hypothetical protein
MRTAHDCRDAHAPGTLWVRHSHPERHIHTPLVRCYAYTWRMNASAAGA